VKKPVNIIYGVDETPPFLVTLLSGVQLVGLTSIYLLIPLAVCREAGLDRPAVQDVLSLSMLVLALGANLQAFRRGPVGSGFLAPTIFTSAYLPASLLAAKMGGMALVSGMTVFGGLLNAGLSRLLRHLRPFFPPEVAGFVVVMIGITTGSLGLRNFLGIGTSQPGNPRDLLAAFVSLGIMVALNVWSKGSLRVLCALIGMAAGYAVAAMAGRLHGSDLAVLSAAPIVRWPHLGHVGWSFDAGLVIPFAVAGLATCPRAMADITTCQKINDAEWVRPDLRSISGGVLADSLATVVTGLVGSTGVSTHTASVGLTNATGVTSRRVALAIGGVFVFLALMPKLAAVLAIIPPPVMGASLLFVTAFTLVNGLQIIASRMLDARRTFVFGLAFMGGLAVDLYPNFFEGLPPSLRPFAGSSFVLGTLAAVGLNLLFRLGVRRTQAFRIDRENPEPLKIEEFMESQGAAWGARRDVIDRASFNLTQSVETIVESCKPEGPLEIAASFDEFNLDIMVTYAGAPLELPETRPTNEEIMASEEGQRKLAGFMVRRSADWVQSSYKNGRSTVLFHFDH